MVHHLTHLAVVLLAPFLLLHSSDQEEISPEKFPSEFGGGTCIEVIDPNTGLPGTAFIVDTICQGNSLDFCLTTSGCNEDIEIIAVTGNEGQVIVTPPSSPFNYCISYTAPADLVGEDTFDITVTNTDGGGNVIGTTSIELTFVVADPSNNTTVSGPQDICSPANSAILEAINPDPIVGGYWVLIGGGTIADITQPIAEVTDLPFGEHIFIWRQDYPCQSTFDVTKVTVYDGQAPVADAGESVTMCSSDNTYTMQANDPLFSATGTWEITFGNATINDINDPNASVTNLGIGCNEFRWNINNGPCPGGETESTMLICVYDINTPQSDAGEDIEICADPFGDNSVFTSALDLEPFDPATGLWTPISGFGVIEDSDDNETLIENLQIGTNRFVWTVENGDCPGFPSTDTLDVRVYDPAHPALEAGVSAEYCAPVTEHILSASNTISPAIGTWTVISGTGSFSEANDPNATVSNLSIGVNTYRWTVYNGPCNDDTFFDEVTVTVYDPNVSLADAGSDLVFCEADFVSKDLEASEFVFPATGIWSVEVPSGISATDILSDVTDPNATLSGITPGEYVLRWTVNNGPCAAGSNFDEITILIYPTIQVVADAGTDLDLCTPITSFNLDGNTPLSPAIGTWTRISGSGIILDENDPQSGLTNLAVGQNVFRWTIDNGGCEASPNFSEVTISVFNVDADPASAGVDQEFCHSVVSVITVELNANNPTGPAIGEWAIISGSGTFSDVNDPDATVTAPGIGINIYEWSIDNGACDVISNTDQVEIAVYNSLEPAADAGSNIEICSDQLTTGLSANIPSEPAIGVWSVVQGTGSFSDINDPNADASGYSFGTNTYRWTITNGPCDPPFTFDDVEVIVYNENVDVADAGEDIEICNNFGPVAMNATSFTAPATGQWTVIIGTGDFANENDPNSTVTGWSIGDNVYEWSVNNGPCSGGTNNDQITVTVYDINADQSDAGLDQELCTPITATTLDATTPSSPSTGFWTVEEGTGLFLDDTDPNTQVTGLSVGINRFKWTIDNGACSPIFSEDEVSILLFQEGAAVSDAGPDQNFCEPVSSTSLAGNTPDSPSTGVWTRVAGDGVITDPTDPNSTVTGLTQGINVFRWTVDAGPCIQDDQSDLMSINIFEDEHPPVSAGDDIEVCTPQSSVQLDGSSPVSPASGTWIQVSGPNAAAFDPDEDEAIVTGLIPGVYVFQWQVDIGPCDALPLSDQMTIFVYDTAADAADAGSDITLCTPNNSTSLSGNSPVGAATGEWTVVSGSGSIVDSSDPITGISNLIVGENRFVWTIDNGSCGLQTTTDTVSVFLFDSTSPDAFAGPDQSLCTPQSTATVSGNEPIFPATVEWQLVSGSGSVTSPNSSTTELTGLAVGENIFSYTIYNGNCANAVTTDQVSIRVFDSGAPAANAGIDQELCSPTSSTQMTADAAVNPGIGTWSLVSGSASVIISNVNDEVATISNLQIGTYIFEWSLDYSTCGTQADQVVITVFDSGLGAANAGDDITLCLPVNTVDLDAISVALPALGTWSVLVGSATFSDANDPLAEVSNLAVGENLLVWNVYNGSCSAPEDLTDTVRVLLFEENLPAAFAGINQEFCSSLTSVTTAQMTAFAAPTPGVGEWSIIQGNGSFSDINDPNATVTGIGLGVNIYEWTIDYGVCASSSSDQVIMDVYNANEPVANAGPDQLFCTPVVSVQLAANTPSLPATGSWTQIVGTSVFSDVTDPNATITNLGVGVTILRWSISNGPCDPSSTNDLITIFVYDESADDAAVGEDQELCIPNTSTNLQGNLPVFPGLGTWSQIEGTSTINNTNNPNSPVSNLSSGVNVFVWEIFNGPCLNATSTDTLIISVFDPTSPLADAGLDQDLCSFTTSASLAASVPISPGSGEWIQVLGIPATIDDINDPNTSVSDLSIGINTFQWSVYNGPCENSISSDVLAINVYDENQSEADAGVDQDLCLPVNATNFSGNSATSPAVGQWSLVQGAGTIADATNPTSAVSDLGVGENIFTWTIDNGACSNPISRDTVYLRLFDPGSEPAFTEPDFSECAPVSVLDINANEALGASIGTWTQVEGSAIIADVNDNTTQISNLDVGTYRFAWEIDNGPCGLSSDTLKVEIFSPAGLDADAGENQSYCTPVNSTFLEGSELTSPATGQWQVVIGNGTVLEPENPLSEITNLTVGETILSWTVDNGPCSGISSDFVSIFIFDETAPDAIAGDDQEFCLPITNTSMTATDAVFPAIGSWILIEGNGTIQNINSANSAITDLTVGENRFVWSVQNSPCENALTRDTVTILIFPNDFSLASAGDDQEFCSPINSTFTEALVPDIPSVGSWSLTQGSGSIVEENNPNSEIIQLGIGTNTFAWQVYHGPCDPELSIDFMSIAIYDVNHPPAEAGEDQEFCLPDNSTMMDATPTSDPVVGNWSLLSGGGTIVTPDAPDSEITDLPVGENLFIWTIDNGPCENPITRDTVTVRIFTEDAPLANAGLDKNLCGETAVVLGAEVPPPPVTGVWSVVSGPNSWSFNDITDPNAILTGLVVGQYVLQWTIDNGPCSDPISSDEVIINVFDVNQNDAFAGDTLLLCWPITDIILDADTVAHPSVGTWTLAGTGDFSDINDPHSIFSNTSIGEHILTWTVDNGPCGVTSDDLVIQIFDPNSPSADAGPDQSICTDPQDGNEAVMSANTPVFPGYGTWVTIFGTPPIISDINDPNATMTDFGYGETQLEWQFFNGPCESGSTSDVVSIFHFDSNESDANAGVDQEFCDVPLNVILAANPTIGNTAVGTWTVALSPIDSDPLVFVDVNEEGTIASGFELGIYQLAWTVDNGFCGTTQDTMQINIFDPNAAGANAGLDMEICEDEFEDSPSILLDGNFVDPPATVLWSVIEGEPIIDQSALDTSNPEITDLGEIDVPLGTVQNTFVYTINNGLCGTSMDTVSLTLIDCLTIDVPDAFSPNNDNINDTWFIPNLEKYPGNSIQVFNRWGAKVFEASDYQGDWNGVSDHPATIGDELPVGTYYYVLDLGNGSAAYKGFVYLKR